MKLLMSVSIQLNLSPEQRVQGSPLSVFDSAAVDRFGIAATSAREVERLQRMAGRGEFYRDGSRLVFERDDTHDKLIVQPQRDHEYIELNNLCATGERRRGQIMAAANGISFRSGVGQPAAVAETAQQPTAAAPVSSSRSTWRMGLSLRDAQQPDHLTHCSLGEFEVDADGDAFTITAETEPLARRLHDLFAEDSECTAFLFDSRVHLGTADADKAIRLDDGRDAVLQAVVGPTVRRRYRVRHAANGIRLEPAPRSPAETRLIRMSAKALRFEAARVGVPSREGMPDAQLIAAILNGDAVASDL
jgi:hypothetical protein